MHVYSNINLRTLCVVHILLYLASCVKWSNEVYGSSLHKRDYYNTRACVYHIISLVMLFYHSIQLSDIFRCFYRITFLYLYTTHTLEYYYMEK